AFTHLGPRWRIGIMNADGTDRTWLMRRHGQWPAWSPDGRMLAAQHCNHMLDPLDGERCDIYILELASGVTTRLTHDRAPETDLEWSPMGDELAFVAKHTVVVISVGGSERRILTAPGANEFDGGPSWSPDATRLVFTRMRS